MTWMRFDISREEEEGMYVVTVIVVYSIGWIYPPCVISLFPLHKSLAKFVIL